MKNNYEVKNMNEIVEIKDDELKMVTGGFGIADEFDLMEPEPEPGYGYGPEVATS